MLASGNFYNGNNRQLHCSRDGYALLIERFSRGYTYTVQHNDRPLIRSDFFYPTPGEAVRAGKSVLAEIFRSPLPPVA